MSVKCSSDPLVLELAEETGLGADDVGGLLNALYKRKMLVLPADHPVREQEFDRFWAAYPKKIGKEAARKKFLKVPGGILKAILEAIERQKMTDQWQEENGKYIPYPATWLHQKRWEDEIEVEQKPSRFKLWSPAEIDAL